jgi:hypothetical protein
VEPKGKRIKNVLSYLQENIPGAAPVDAKSEDIEDLQSPPDAEEPGAPKPKPEDAENLDVEIMVPMGENKKKKRLPYA